MIGHFENKFRNSQVSIRGQYNSKYNLLLHFLGWLQGLDLEHCMLLYLQLQCRPSLQVFDKIPSAERPLSVRCGTCPWALIQSSLRRAFFPSLTPEFSEYPYEQKQDLS